MTINRTLDRLPDFDERSRSFPVRALSAREPRSYTWRCDTYLNQGQEGACVGFAWGHEIAGTPKVSPMSNDLARTIYQEAKVLDTWEGEDYSGTSVIAGAKAVQARGYMGEYRWAFGLKDLAYAIGRVGPAVLGIPWLENMEDTDTKGFVHATGEVMGGHAILCNGVNLKDQYFKLHNSWGKSWGINGEAKISFEDMNTLLKDQGEACIPIVRTIKP